MRVSIHSLKRTLFDGEANLVSCQTEVGEITILDHHRPLISVLRAGIMRIVDAEGKEQYFPLKNGFIEVKTGNQVRGIVEETTDRA